MSPLRAGPGCPVVDIRTHGFHTSVHRLCTADDTALGRPAPTGFLRASSLVGREIGMRLEADGGRVDRVVGSRTGHCCPDRSDGDANSLVHSPATTVGGSGDSRCACRSACRPPSVGAPTPGVPPGRCTLTRRAPAGSRDGLPALPPQVGVPGARRPRLCWSESVGRSRCPDTVRRRWAAGPVSGGGGNGSQRPASRGAAERPSPLPPVPRSVPAHRRARTADVLP